MNEKIFKDRLSCPECENSEGSYSQFAISLKKCANDDCSVIWFNVENGRVTTRKDSNKCPWDIGE
jgi:hypothetical protein